MEGRDGAKAMIRVRAFVWMPAGIVTARVSAGFFPILFAGTFRLKRAARRYRFPRYAAMLSLSMAIMVFLSPGVSSISTFRP